MAKEPDRSDDEWHENPRALYSALRPFLEKLDPKNGLSTWNALYHFVDQQEALALYRLAQRYPEGNFTNKSTRSQTFRIKGGPHGIHQVIEQLVLKLKAGELHARGFASHAALDAPRQDIHKDRWADLELDARASRARGAGFEISQILVFDAQPTSVDGRPAKKQYSSAALRTWYIERRERHVAVSKKSTREEDYLDAKADFAGRVSKRPVEDLRGNLPQHFGGKVGVRRRPRGAVVGP